MEGCAPSQICFPDHWHGTDSVCAQAFTGVSVFQARLLGPCSYRKDPGSSIDGSSCKLGVHALLPQAQCITVCRGESQDQCWPRPVRRSSQDTRSRWRVELLQSVPLRALRVVTSRACTGSRGLFGSTLMPKCQAARCDPESSRSCHAVLSALLLTNGNTNGNTIDQCFIAARSALLL
jgi:hypothetical protein